jgi:hypothetical protein
MACRSVMMLFQMVIYEVVTSRMEVYDHKPLLNTSDTRKSHGEDREALIFCLFTYFSITFLGTEPFIVLPG